MGIPRKQIIKKAYLLSKPLQYYNVYRKSIFTYDRLQRCMYLIYNYETNQVR